MSAWLADLVLYVHAAFVLFVVGGQILILTGWWRGWSWTRGIWLRSLHLAAIGFVVLEAWVGVTCPLTVLENALRGGAYGTTGFVAHWVRYFLFYQAPVWVFTLIYTIFGLLVLATFIGYPPRRTRGGEI